MAALLLISSGSASNVPHSFPPRADHVIKIAHFWPKKRLFRAPFLTKRMGGGPDECDFPRHSCCLYAGALGVTDPGRRQVESSHCNPGEPKRSRSDESSAKQH